MDPISFLKLSVPGPFTLQRLREPPLRADGLGGESFLSLKLEGCIV